MEWIPILKEPSFPIVLSGPSGVGKTVLCRRLLQVVPWTVRAITATTRPPRGDESNGISYFFYTAEQFLREKAAGSLAEAARVHDHWYGTPRSSLDRQLAEGRSVLLNIDVQGGLSIRRLYSEAVLIFLLPPSRDELEKRLRERGADSEAEMGRRLKTAEMELKALSSYDYVVINRDLERAVEELVAILVAEKSRVARRLFAEAGR